MTSDAGTEKREKPEKPARPARNPWWLPWLPGYRMTVGANRANQSSKIRDYFLDVASTTDSTTICKKGPRTGRQPSQPQGKQPLILRIDDFLSVSVIVRIRIEHTKAKNYQSP